MNRRKYFKPASILAGCVFMIFTMAGCGNSSCNNGKVLTTTKETPQQETPEETVRIEKTTKAEEPPQLIIELDPGHGGEASGAEAYGVSEKDINLKIALYAKEELEAYENVTVYLTREDDSPVELEARVEKAVRDGADAIISLHNNGSGTIADYYNGCTVLVPRGVFREDLSKTGQELGCYILKELSELGIENQGLMFRMTQDELYYDNGTLCDYYSIVRNATKAGIPGIIVEHAFLDDEEDYLLFLSDEEKLKALGKADAAGIAGYYGLVKKDGGEAPEQLKNYREKITLITTDFYEDNEYLEKTYFTE